MGQTIELNGNFIKPRDMQVIDNTLNQSGVIILPTDSGYSFLCRLGDKVAANKIRQIKGLDKNHLFTVLCPDLSRLATYAQIDNVQYRLLKRILPGLFTCILPAGKEAPRLVQHDKRKTIGIRVPADDERGTIIHAVLKEQASALMGVSVFSADDIMADLYEVDKKYLNQVDLIVDQGERINSPSTLLDLTTMPPLVLREGAGDLGAIISE